MKKIKRNRLVILLITGLLLAGCRHDSAESHTLNDLAERTGSEFRALYFYPSTVRMLTRIFADSAGTSLQEIRRGRIFFTLSDDEETIKERFKTLQTEIEDEGYENLMKLKSPGSQMSAFLKDAQIPDYVIFMHGDAGYIIVEVSGKLSPAGLREISNLDFSKAAEMFDLLPVNEEATNDSIQKLNPKSSQE